MIGLCVWVWLWIPVKHWSQTTNTSPPPCSQYIHSNHPHLHTHTHTLQSHPLTQHQFTCIHTEYLRISVYIPTYMHWLFTTLQQLPKSWPHVIRTYISCVQNLLYPRKWLLAVWETVARLCIWLISGVSCCCFGNTTDCFNWGLA